MLREAAEENRCNTYVYSSLLALSPLFRRSSFWGLPVDAQTSPTAAEKRDGPSSEATAIAPKVKDKNFYLSAISKAIVDEASRLKNDAAGWGQKLQELDLDLSKNQQDIGVAAKDIDECLLVLRAAADRLAPDEETRAVMRKQEGAIRDLASRAEVHPDPDIRKTAGYFQQKTTELHALNRSVEEIRTRLVTQMDRLEELKIQLEFNRTAPRKLARR
jgi:DNA repair exonuclease SbcCD ATPase subunit